MKIIKKIPLKKNLSIKNEIDENFGGVVMEAWSGWYVFYIYAIFSTFAFSQLEFIFLF